MASEAEISRLALAVCLYWGQAEGKLEMEANKMAGEMFESEVTREAYPLHFAIADAVKGRVRPFDQYQGPYVVVGPDIRAGCEPYAAIALHRGTVRLWVVSEDGATAQVYNEASELRGSLFHLYPSGEEVEQAAVESALEALQELTAT